MIVVPIGNPLAIPLVMGLALIRAILGPTDPQEFANWRAGLTDTTHGGDPEWKTVTLQPGSSEFCLSGADSGGVNLYQSVGGGLDLDAKGYVITGAHRNDPGSGNNDTANFSGDLRVHEIEQAQGAGFQTPQVVGNFNLPGEGDYSLSPTSKFITGRFGIDGKQAGYRMRSLAYMLQQGDGNYSTQNDNSVSTICHEGRGSKPMFSIDERFIAYHQYEDSGSGTAANVYIVDLLSDNPQPIQITKFGGNDRGLFAHFRADGWLYWLYEDGSNNKKIHATNIAILMGR